MSRKSNLAYQNYETAQEQKKQQPAIKKVSKRRTANYIRPYKAIALIIVAVVITSSMVLSMVQLNEINDQISAATAELETQKSEAVRLNMELNKTMSINNIEEYAETELGMIKMQSNQVEYISSSSGNSIEIPEDKDTTIFEKIKDAFTSFVEYLAG